MSDHIPCPSNSPSGRACQSPRHHLGPHRCCYPGGSETWEDKANAIPASFTHSAHQPKPILSPGDKTSSRLGPRRLVFPGDVITAQKNNQRYKVLVTDVWDERNTNGNLCRSYKGTILQLC